MNAGGERRRENGCGQSSHGMGHPIGRSSTLSLELPELDGEAVVAIAEPVMGFQIDAVAHRVHRAITHGHVQDAGVGAAETVPVGYGLVALWSSALQRTVSQS